MSKHTTLNNFNVTKEIGVFGQLIVPRYMLSYSDPTRNNFSGNQQVLPLKNNIWLQEVYPKIVDETLSRIAVGDRSKIWYFTPVRDEGLPVRETSDIKLILRNEIAGTLSSDYSPYCNTCQDMCCAPRKSTSIYYYIGNDANPVVKEGYTDFYVELRQIELKKEDESGEVKKEWSEKLYIVLKKLGATEEDEPKYYCILDENFAFTEKYEVVVKPDDDDVLLSKTEKQPSIDKIEIIVGIYYVPTESTWSAKQWSEQDDWWWSGILNTSDKKTIEKSCVGIATQSEPQKQWCGQIGGVKFNPDWDYSVTKLYSDFNETEIECDIENFFIAEYPTDDYTNAAVIKSVNVFNTDTMAYKMVITKTGGDKNQRLYLTLEDSIHVGQNTNLWYPLYKSNGQPVKYTEIPIMAGYIPALSSHYCYTDHIYDFLFRNNNGYLECKYKNTVSQMDISSLVVLWNRKKTIAYFNASKSTYTLSTPNGYKLYNEEGSLIAYKDVVVLGWYDSNDEFIDNIQDGNDALTARDLNGSLAIYVNSPRDSYKAKGVLFIDR